MKLLQMRGARSSHQGENNHDNKAALLNMLAAHGYVAVRVFWTYSQVMGRGGVIMSRETYMGKVPVGLYV